MELLDDNEPVYDPVTPHTAADRTELRQHLEAAIGQLRPAYREVYLLREAEGMSYDEIAAVTGSTLSAVRSKLFKSRAALHELLAPYMNERER
jgi:RNA polymerase sigma-70 factor (ECF subfamily)